MVDGPRAAPLRSGRAPIIGHNGGGGESFPPARPPRETKKAGSSAASRIVVWSFPSGRDDRLLQRRQLVEELLGAGPFLVG